MESYLIYMSNIKVLCIGDTNIPLHLITSFNYNKSANIIETSSSKKSVITRGFKCQSITFSISLNVSSVEYFRQCNQSMYNYTFSDLVRYFIEYKIDKSNNPFQVVLADNIICHELMFTPTSISNTFQSDENGNIQQMDSTFVLSGCRCSKLSRRNKPIINTDFNVLNTTITVNGYKLECKNDISITEYEITPTTLHIQLLISDSYVNKNQIEWTSPVNMDSYIDVDGLGRFYIITASVDDNFITYECSIFNRDAEDVICESLLDCTFDDVLHKLKLNINNNIHNINIDYYKMNDSSINILREIQTYLGVLISFNMNTVYITEIPTNAQMSNNNSLDYYLNTNIKSAHTKNIIIHDSIHNNSSSTYKSGHSIILNSPICTSDNRSQQIMNYYNLMENEITIQVPYDKRIRHNSWIRVHDNNTEYNCLITNYTINVLDNYMNLTLNYIG